MVQWLRKGKRGDTHAHIHTCDILVFITLCFQLFYRSETFQNRKLGKKAKANQKSGNTKPSLSQVFKETYLGKKTVREGCDPRSRQDQGRGASEWLEVSSFSTWLADTGMYTLELSGCLCGLLYLYHISQFLQNFYKRTDCAKYSCVCSVAGGREQPSH